MSGEPPASYNYKVLVDDNFHYMDEGKRYTHGEFDTCEQAIAACKRIVDDFLLSSDLQDTTPESLYSQYTMFGDDPFIVSQDPACKFSAWDYAKRRCTELLQG